MGDAGESSWQRTVGIAGSLETNKLPPCWRAVRIKDGAASYCNRFVETARVKQEWKVGYGSYSKFGDTKVRGRQREGSGGGGAVMRGKLGALLRRPCAAGSSPA